MLLVQSVRIWNTINKPYEVFSNKSNISVTLGYLYSALQTRTQPAGGLKVKRGKGSSTHGVRPVNNDGISFGMFLLLIESRTEAEHESNPFAPLHFEPQMAKIVSVTHCM